MKHAVVVGTGNVASHLAKALLPIADLVTIVGRSEEKAASLASNLGTQHSTIASMPQEASVYFLAISDDAIKKVTAELKIKGIVVHTSGSVPMEAMLGNIERVGVFYPLQTFTKNLETDWSNIPLLIEANNQKDEDFLVEIASKISQKVERVDSVQRGKMHVAAVFANNFTNYMFFVAQDLLKKSGLPKDFLNALVQETVRKAVETSPEEAQTGPAKRQDVLTMQRHLEALSEHPDYKKIYALLSEQIRTYYG